MTGFDPQTLGFYSAQAGIYLGFRPENASPELDGFLKLLPAGGRILELGCGGGCDAAYMIAHGFDVDATDGAAEMAAEAEVRLGRLVRVMRFDELESVEAYDAVVATASLLHVPAGELSSILARIWRALKPQGWHLATYKTGAPEGRDEHGRYYNYLSRNDAEVHYRSAGNWAALVYEESLGVGYFSKPAIWLKVIAQKKA